MLRVLIPFIIVLVFCLTIEARDPLCGIARCYNAANPFPLYVAARAKHAASANAMARFTAVWGQAGHQLADYCPNNIANQNTNVAQLDNHRCNTFVFGTNNYMDFAADYGMVALELYNYFISLDDTLVGFPRFSDPFDYKVMLAETTNAILKIDNMYTAALPYDVPVLPPCRVAINAPANAVELKFQQMATSCEIWTTTGHNPGYTCLEIHHVLNNPPAHVYIYDNNAFTDITNDIATLRGIWTAVEAAFQHCHAGTNVAHFASVHAWAEIDSMLAPNKYDQMPEWQKSTIIKDANQLRMNY